MSDDVTVEIQGLDLLQKAFEEMPAKIAKRGIKKALGLGAKPVESAMVSGAPRHTGFLAEHFGTRFSMGRDGLSGSALIGPKGKIDYPAFASGAYKIVRNAKDKAKQVGKVAVAAVARWLEFGTSKMRPHPFMTQAFESNKSQAADLIIESMKETVDEIAKE